MLLLAGLLLGSCGYRFTADSDTRLAANQTIWVPYLKNATVHANASVLLKRALFEQFAAQRGIAAATAPEQADFVIEGSLTSYGASVVSYSAADTATEYRLTLTAQLVVRKRGEDKQATPLWQGTLTTWQDYPVGATLELQRSSEDAAMQAACRKMAQQLIWHLEQQY